VRQTTVPWQWTFGQLALNVEEERLIQVIARIIQALAGAPAELA
jgi:hypothetical protein